MGLLMADPAGWSNWPAPAKLNLFLHITGRRADGYHLLQTAFQLLDWGDTVRLRLRDDGEIRRIDPLPGVLAEHDLAVRAARALREATGSPLGADIAIDKRIPLGGGLGGGSSDAATTLVALNRLWQTGLDEDALAGLGLGLGADVPVFVRGRSAFAAGIGEVLTPVELPERWFVVIHPRVHVPTAAVFQAPELTRNSPKITMRALLQTGGRNDCESVVRARFPEVADALDWLAQFGPSRLTGTGACVFVALPDEHTARAVRSRLPARWSGYVVRGLNRSPLLSRVTDR